MRRLVALCLTALVTACGTTVAASPTPSPTTLTPTPSTAVGGGSRYVAAVDAAHRHGLGVWLETDLVKRWLQGPSALAAAVAQLATLGRRPGVVGVKIADELDYRDGLGDDPAQVQRFLDDAAAAVRRSLPGTRILVDLVVPQLGCAPGVAAVAPTSQTCAAAAAQRHPALTLDHVGAYLASGDVDVADISTDLFTDATYASWGIDRARAQRAAWQEVARRGWQRHVTLQGRKALAHPGAYQGGSTQAADDLHVFVDIPLSTGATAVDVWTWRQTYQGQVVRLLDPGLGDNALWAGLRQRRAAGAVLFTHFTPSSLEVGLDADLDVLSQVFTDVFVAAGTG